MSDPEPSGRWRRWQARPRRLRWTTYGAVAFVGLGLLGAVIEDPETDETVTSETLPPPTATETTETTPVTTEEPATTIAETSTTASTTSSSSTTSTTTTEVPPTTVEGSQLALDVLALGTVENEHPDGYDRSLFGYGDSVDERGCRTRALVLMRDSLTPAQVDPVGCAVVAGDWFSVYEGVTWSDPAEIEIDHVVALKEAWDSGAWGWTPERRSAFANDLEDPRTLRAVTGSINQAKGAADPSNWIPPDESFVCTYIGDWVAIKARWGLSMDQSEHGRIRNLLTDRCDGHTIAPWPETAPAGPPITIPPPPPPVAPPPVPVLPVAPLPPPQDANCDPAYPDVCIPPSPPDLNCGDISFRRFRVLPPDPHRFDADKDGIGCES